MKRWNIVRKQIQKTSVFEVKCRFFRTSQSKTDMQKNLSEKIKFINLTENLHLGAVCTFFSRIFGFQKFIYRNFVQKRISGFRIFKHSIDFNNILT